MRTRLILAFIVAVCLMIGVISPALAEKSYLAERFDVTIAIQPDGTLNIAEKIVFRFSGGSFTYVFRELAFNRLDDIDNIQASLDGQPLAPGTLPGQVEITTGRPIMVTWHFAPAQDEVHEFLLTYRVLGAVRQDATTDTLVWRAIPEEHEYTISQSLIRVEYPAGVMPSSPPSLSTTAAAFEDSPSAATFTLNEIEEDTPVDVTVTFPGQSLIAHPPAWQAGQLQKAQRTSTGLPFGLGAAAITALVGVMGVILAGRSFRRDTDTYQTSPYQGISSPPGAIPPALAAKLAGNGVPFLGTLFDLAQRGILRIEEGPKSWGSRKFYVTRQPSGESLQRHEQVFLDALFHKSMDENVPLSKIASLASSTRFSQALDEELTALGWRDADRSSRRSRFLAASIFVFLGGLVALGAGIFTAAALPETLPDGVVIGAILMGVGAAAILVGLVGLIAAAVVSTQSDQGARQASAWRSFAAYLRSISGGREPATTPDLFGRYLPYAASLGLATAWAKFFQKQANVPVPEWFMGVQSSMDDGSFAAIMAAISSADSSASAASGGGAGGASGGGSSGAG